jgi:membrane associated rhomboid family serine protease
VKTQKDEYGSTLEAILYPLLLVAVMWVVFWAERVSGYDLVQYGIRPQHWESWKGVLFMPLLHAPNDSGHIINNTFPVLFLFGALVYYYRRVAFRVLALSWLVTGLSVWWLSEDDSAYHIGMSGVIYALFGFLFLSGFFRGILRLQALTLIVVVLYGSMVWGIFPQKATISWEGHLSGLFIGVVLAVYYRKKGPQRQKFQYEIEQEMGIEPPDLEGMYNARVAAMEQQRLEMERLREEMARQQQEAVRIVYHIRPSNSEPPKEEPPTGEDTPPGDNAER